MPNFEILFKNVIERIAQMGTHVTFNNSSICHFLAYFLCLLYAKAVQVWVFLTLVLSILLILDKLEMQILFFHIDKYTTKLFQLFDF